MIFNELTQRVSKIEEKQNQILNDLSDMKKLLEDNNRILTENIGTYKDKKMRNLRNTMLGGKFNSKQLDTLGEIVSIFKEILEDKEIVEKELQVLIGEQNGQM